MERSKILVVDDEKLVRQIEHGAPAQTVTLQPELQQGESVRAI